MSKTLHTNLILSGWQTSSNAGNKAKNATLTYHVNARDNIRYGATGSYDVGYACRAIWDNYMSVIPASEILSMTFYITSDYINIDCNVHFGPLRGTVGAQISETEGASIVINLAPKTVNEYTYTDSTYLALLKNQYGIGVGGTVSTAAYGYIRDVSCDLVVNSYNITYNKGLYGVENNLISDDIAYKEPVTLEGVLFSRPGYVQRGWSINANGSTKDFDFNEVYTGVTSNMVLYPYWERNVVNCGATEDMIFHNAFVI